MVNVELVYVPVDQATVHLRLAVATGSSVADVLEQSGLLQSYPETRDMPTGIFGTVVPLAQVVKSGDRIEVYRPLLSDPKEKRRQRACQKG